jgi:hypothetical protein
MTRALRIVRPSTAFSLSSGKKRPREKMDAHLTFIRGLACVICGSEPEPAHLRFGSRLHGKPGCGGAEKPSDKYTTPLCPEHHRLGNESQHVNGNEIAWWSSHGIDPIIISALLFQVSGDHEAGMLICENARALCSGFGRRG